MGVEEILNGYCEEERLGASERWQRLRMRGMVVVVRGLREGADVTGWKW